MDHPFDQRPVTKYDWPEDFDHENGQYQNECIDCGMVFVGHKRRAQCKSCWCILAERTYREQHAKIADLEAKLFQYKAKVKQQDSDMADTQAKLAEANDRLAEKKKY